MASRKRKRPVQTRSTLADPDEHLWEPLTGHSDDDSAATSRAGGTMSISAVFAAIRLLSETIASLPLKGYSNAADGSRTRDDSPEVRLLRLRPNTYMSAFTFWECMIREHFWNGNAFAEIERAKSGRPIAFHPITQSTVTIEKLRAGLRYTVRDKRGRTGAPIPQADMLHVPLMPEDGVIGVGIKTRARRSLHLALSADVSAASAIENDQTPGGVLKTQGTLKADARATLRKEWAEMHSGPRNRRKPAILQEGMEFEAIAQSAAESQLLETRRFQVLEVARWLNIPPHMLRELTQATFSNIEHQGIDFAKYTLVPICEKFEQECDFKLWGYDLPRQLEWDLDGILRGDQKSRFESWAIGRQNGFLSADDIRGKENWNPIGGEDGAAYLVNGSMKSIKAARLALPGGTPNDIKQN